MAKKIRQEESTDGWKDTYGDMVTLLLCFFVLLYSMSAVDQEKWQKFIKAFSNPGTDTAQVVLQPSDELGDHLVPADNAGDVTDVELSDEYPSEFDELYEYLKDFTEAQGMQDSVELSRGEGVVYIRYKNSLFFLPDSATLTQEAKPSLDFLGGSLKNLEDDIWLVSISGHTASVGISDYGVSDWLLSAERAGNVAIHFEEESGLDPKLLRPIGFGKNYPIASNDTEEGRERNRRVELVIVSKNSTIAQSEMLSGAVSSLFDPSQFPQQESVTEILDPTGMSGPDDMGQVVPPVEDISGPIDSMPETEG